MVHMASYYWSVPPAHLRGRGCTPMLKTDDPADVVITAPWSVYRKAKQDKAYDQQLKREAREANEQGSVIVSG